MGFFLKKSGFFSTLGGEFIPVSNIPRTAKVRWNLNILLLLHVEYEKRFELICDTVSTVWRNCYWVVLTDRQSNRPNYSILVCCVCSQAFAN